CNQYYPISSIAAHGGMAASPFACNQLDVTSILQSLERVCGKTTRLPPDCCQGTDIGPESATEELFGGYKIAGLLIGGQLIPIDEGSFEPEFLGSDNGLDGGFNLAFEVVALVDHKGNILGNSLGVGGVNLMEDAENLIRIDGAEGEVVVGVRAVGEVKAAKQACVQQPGDNLLNVLRGVVVAGIDKDASLRTGKGGQMGGHAPVGDVGVIEGRFERLVFDQQALLRGQVIVAGAKSLLKPANAAADALGAGIIRAVGKPQRYVARIEALADLDAVQDMVDGLLTDRRRGIAKRAEFVFLILKEVGVDGTGTNAVLRFELRYLRYVIETVGQIPKHVKSQRGSYTSEPVDLRSVSEFLLDGGSGGSLDKLSKAGAGVGESPGGNLNLE